MTDFLAIVKALENPSVPKPQHNLAPRRQRRAGARAAARRARSADAAAYVTKSSKRK